MLGDAGVKHYIVCKVEVKDAQWDLWIFPSTLKNIHIYDNNIDITYKLNAFGIYC